MSQERPPLDELEVEVVMVTAGRADTTVCLNINRISLFTSFEVD